MDESKKLAGFLSEVSYNDINREVIERTKDLILDQLGVEIATSAKPWSLAVYKYARSFDDSMESTIIRYGDKVKAENAVFVNGTFGHGFELDDTYLPGNTHPGAVVIPAALALAEREAIDGKTFVIAIVAGYEAINRVGRSMAPSCLGRGFHPTLITGPLGAAAVTGKLLGFQPERMLNAISIAGSHSSGLMEYTQTGGSVKRIYAGMAAFAGVRAGFLAQAGITGPPTILEGRSGFCQAFSDEYRLNDIVSNLGKEFSIPEMSLKQHCCCYQIQAPLDGALKIIREHGIGPNEIEEIVIGTNRNGVVGVGAIVDPEEITAAQFSAPFSVAMGVIKGRAGFREYTEENLRDTEIKALARRVRLEVDEEVQSLYPGKRAVRMTVKLKDGTIYQEKLDGAKGTPVNPMSRIEVEEKFLDLATMVLPRTRAEEIITTVRGLEEVKHFSTFMRLLVA